MFCRWRFKLMQGLRGRRNISTGVTVVSNYVIV